MDRLRCLKLPMLWACCVLASGAAAQEGVITLTPPAGEEDRAMGRGDLKTLDTLLASAGDPVRRELISAYKARLEFRLADSDLHAERCSDLAQMDIRQYYASEAKCRSVLAGNRLLAGDTAGWIDLMRHALVAVEQFARDQAYQLYPGKFAADARVTLPGAVTLPEVDAGSPSFLYGHEGEVVKRVPYLDEGTSSDGTPNGPFTIEAYANGELADFIFDTGAQTLIGGRLAKRLFLDAGQSAAGNINLNIYLQGRKVAARLVALKSLRFGSFEARDMTVLLSDDPEMPNVIGLNVMRNMRPFRVTKDRVEMDASSSCDSKFMVASNAVATNSFLVASVEIEGRPVLSDIDTGNPSLVIEYEDREARAPVPEAGQITVNGQKAAPIRRAKGSEYGADYNVGAALLESQNIFLDFSARRICFEDRLEI
ncbi:aspartyl protease family protein [Xanthomonas hyacinthi]|nr:retropepsin-like aspartic protease [Xanthomonas hyacinthi]